MANPGEHENRTGDKVVAVAAGTAAGAGTFAVATHLLKDKAPNAAQGVLNAAQSAGTHAIQLVSEQGVYTKNAGTPLVNNFETAITHVPAAEASAKAGNFFTNSAGKIGDVVKNSGKAFGQLPPGKKALVIAAVAATTAVAGAGYMHITKPHNSLGNPPDAELSGRVAGREQNRER